MRLTIKVVQNNILMYSVISLNLSAPFALPQVAQSSKKSVNDIRDQFSECENLILVAHIIRICITIF